MGLFDKLINFGNNRRGKIISWVIVLGSTIVFFIGVVMTNASTGASTVRNITLSSSNMEYVNSLVGNDAQNYAGYHMTLTTLTAHVTAFTDPMDTDEPVVFTTNSPLLEFDRGGGKTSSTTRVPAGGTAILKMKKFNGNYGFSSPDPYEFGDVQRVVVKCSGASATIFVRILLDDTRVSVTATLEQSIAHQANSDSWYPVDHINMFYFNPSNTNYLYAIKYRVRIRVFMYDELVLDTGSASFIMSSDNEYADYVNLRNIYSNFIYQETWVHNLFTQTFEPSEGGEESYTKTLQLFRGFELGQEQTTSQEKYHIVANYINNPLKVYFRIAYRVHHGENDYTDYFTKSDFVVNVVSYVPNFN